MAYRLDLPCSLEGARVAGYHVRDFFTKAGLSEDELEVWELVTVEAATNAVAHCPMDERHLPLRIEAAVDSSCVSVRVDDHTVGFDFRKEVPLPSHESESGRGLFLIQTLTDLSDYRRGRIGNSFYMEKARAPRSLPVVPPPAAAPKAASVANPRVEELEYELELMTEELAATYESLSAIFNFTATLGQSSEPLDLIDPWMKELSRITAADWHAFYLPTADGTTLKLSCGFGAELPDKIQIARSELPEENQCISSRTVHARHDGWFDLGTEYIPDDPLISATEGSCGFVHAVFLGTNLVGLAALGRRVNDYPFTAGQVNVIHTFTDFLGAQIMNARIQKEITESQIVRREVEIAAGIQHALLPARLPPTPGLEIFGSATNAREVGGDFYDVIGFEDGSALVVIADVMGKGVPAALFATILRSLTRSHHDLAQDPGALLEWINTTIHGDFERVEMFATMQILYFDAITREVRVAGAGHCPMLLVDESGTFCEYHSESMPLGIDVSLTFPTHCFNVPLGMRALLYTDGLTDARDTAGEAWGNERLRAWFCAPPCDVASAAALSASLQQELTSYRGTAPALDDITFVVILAKP